MKKRHSFKIPRGDGVMVFCFLAVCICMTLILSNLDLIKQNEFIARNGYSELVRTLDLEETEGGADLLKAAEPIKTPMTLYRTKLDEKTDLRGILIKGTPDYPLPMIKGRFFTEEDSFSKNPVAVVGNAFEKDIFQKDGRDWIQIAGTDFEVIGIVGVELPSRLDGLRIINMDAAQKLYGVSGVYQIDAKDKKAIKDAYTAFKQNLGSSVNLKAREIEDRKTYTMTEDPITGQMKTVERDADAYIHQGIGIYIYWIILITFLLCTLSTTIFWAQNRFHEVAVERMIGFSGLQILINRLKHYLPLCILGGVIGILLLVLFALTGLLPSPSLWNILFGLLLSISCGILILLGVSCYVFRRDITQELR